LGLFQKKKNLYERGWKPARREEESQVKKKGWNPSRRRIPGNKMIRALPEAEIQWG
jgi:hypothetical protein